MSGKQEGASGKPWSILIVTGGFFFIYTGIHIGLNLTNNGSTELQSASIGTARFFSEISGPITIGLCTSLLILSFGMFLHHGRRGISLASPGSFSSAFLIFAMGITVVQMSGHAEIYVNACSLNENPCTVSIPMKIISVTSYLLTWPVLAWLESFYKKTYEKLQDQLPEAEESHIGGAKFLVGLTVISAILTLTKLIFSFVSDETSTKAAVSILILFEEFCLVALILYHYFGHSESKA